ncbi:hypothetical protein DSO57_1000133 [Entomophthora muscae]|uniref:Uncharacterized protein n=1 Tax=Entomophthora muscae TaxID=34485 RepID=A0ACC2SMH5_9FUNG|nr:hypothetical protein DSO57_1000133 [Entomophthora muscae]
MELLTVGLIGFVLIFGTAAVMWAVKDIIVPYLAPKKKEPIYEKIDPFAVNQTTSKDVKLSEIMTLQKSVFWCSNEASFPDYHLAFSGYNADKTCVDLEDKVVRCDVEEKRVFRWLPGFDLSPSVQCAAQQQCYVPFPIFKTSHRVIKYQDIDRFPIVEYILSQPQPTFRALQGPGLPFKGPVKKSIWSKVLYLYVQGYFTTTRNGGKTKLTPYNHTVAIDLGEGLLDAIYGLTPNQEESM